MNRSRREGSPLLRAGAYAFLSILSIIILLPLVWAFFSALKLNEEVFTVPMRLLPATPRWENFIEPFKTSNFGTYFKNSFIVATSVTLIVVLTSFLGGYSFAKFNYPGKRLLFVLIISTMMLPIQVILVPLYLITRQLGWINSYAGLIIPQAVSGFGIFLMRQHIMTIPDDFMNQARIDGLGEFGILWLIIAPMSRAVVSALIILTFLGNWDSFLWPLIVGSKESLRTLPVGISLFFGEYSSNYSQALAVSVVIMLPILVLFVIFQRQFVEGLARTGLK